MLLLSSAADLYWLGRYFSRSQELVDLVLASLGAPSPDSLGIPLSITGTWQNFYQQHPLLTVEALAEFFIKATNPTSLSACLEAMRADAQGTRGRIDGELWVAINSLWLAWKERASHIGAFSDHLALYQWLQKSLQSVQILLGQSVDGDVKTFIRLGQLIEALDSAFRRLATPHTEAPSADAIEQWALELADTLAPLDAGLWHPAGQAGAALLALCRLLPRDGKDLAGIQEAQQALQRLTHCLADVFAT